MIYPKKLYEALILYSIMYIVTFLIVVILMHYISDEECIIKYGIDETKNIYEILITYSLSYYILYILIPVISIYKMYEKYEYIKKYYEIFVSSIIASFFITNFIVGVSTTLFEMRGNTFTELVINLLNYTYFVYDISMFAILTIFIIFLTTIDIINVKSRKKKEKNNVEIENIEEYKINQNKEFEKQNLLKKKVIKIGVLFGVILVIIEKIL